MRAGDDAVTWCWLGQTLTDLCEAESIERLTGKRPAPARPSTELVWVDVLLSEAPPR